MDWISLVGTIAFAVSGAGVAAERGMDLFGINVLAIVTACGGGLIRDLMMGAIPPAAFLNPAYVGIAALTANLVFLLLSLHRKFSRLLSLLYSQIMFLFDTLGLAAFTVNGVLIGVQAGYLDHLFLLSFLGAITGVGGGLLRDIMSGRIPDIFCKHVYAMTAILGAVLTSLMLERRISEQLAVLTGFAAILLIRGLAARYHWNLPKIRQQTNTSES